MGRNQFDTFSHLLDNVFVAEVYHYSHGCKVSDILPDGVWMAERDERFNRRHRVGAVVNGFEAPSCVVE